VNQRAQSSVPSFLAGGGAMGERCRRMDWAKTPLGPVEGWPQNLRSAVSMLLSSKAQIVLFYGPDLVALYNDAYAPALGSKHPWALGRPARECWSEIWTDLGALFRGVLESGEAYHAKERRFFLERNGYLEETYFDVSYDPLRGESGAAEGVFCIVSDMTGKVLGERRTRAVRDVAVRTAKAQSTDEVFGIVAEVLAGCAGDVPFSLAYVLDPQTRRARLVAQSGLAPGAPAADAQRWPLEAALASAGLVSVERLASRGVRVSAAPFGDPVDTAVVVPIRAAGYADPLAVLVAGVSPRLSLGDAYRDFYQVLALGIGVALANARTHEEERKRAESLAELDEAKTAFFQNVSHEFRTPLTLIRGPVEELLEMRHGVLSFGMNQQLTMVHRNTLRLQKLVNTLLDFARVEAGRLQAWFSPTDLPGLTSELVSTFRSACERAGLSLRVEAGPFREPLFVDRDMWEKVVLNLLSNAFKFTLAGEIEVRLEDVGTAARLTVRDTGAGIPDEHLPHLFERFHRVENTPARSLEGSGIGLPLVQQLVRMHGGTVGVQSALGRGSTFTVEIPKGNGHLPADRIGAEPIGVPTALSAGHYVEEALAWLPSETEAEPVQSMPSAPPWSVRAAGAAKARILLADDNADMRAYLQRLLGRWYEVEMVADGRAALSALEGRPPDLVLADVMMPHIDGLSLLANIRANPRLHHLPFVLLSARAGEDARVEGIDAGADDYLVKPFSARELLARIGGVLERAGRARTAPSAPA
jgi:signal transduction histidine kinase/ActR/RegA family two-component response regulator